MHIQGRPVIEARAFKEGLISIQDKSSMFVAQLANLQAHDKVLDACSAPGGKACHMAEILAPTGSVDATDIHAHKINLIKYNIKN